MCDTFHKGAKSIWNRSEKFFQTSRQKLRFILENKMFQILKLSKMLLAEVFYNVNYVNVNYSVKNSTVDRKYLHFLQDFFFRLKPKQYKKCQYS